MDNTNKNDKGIIAKKAPPREPIPAGMYLGRCYQMIYLGTVEEEFNGNKKKAQKVRIVFELPTELKVFKDGEEEKPCAIGEEYTLSLSGKANLRKILESWRGKPFTEKEADSFDITKLLGKACMINITHVAGKGQNEGKIYEKISAITPVVKGMPVPEAINEPKYFNFGSNFDKAWVEQLPDFIKNKIKSSDEWKARMDSEGIEASNAELHGGGADGLPDGTEVEVPF